jgi:hypothetical protein
MMEIKHYPPLIVMQWEFEGTMFALKTIPFLICIIGIWL